MRRWLIIGIGAAALVASIGSAFYLGRSSREPFVVESGARRVQGEEGFGKVPVPGVRKIQGAAGSRFPLRSVDPRAALLPLSAGRSSPWRSLGERVKLVWSAGNPKLPESIKVYRPPVVEKERAYELAKALGIDGPPVSISIMRPETPDVDYLYSFEVPPAGNAPPISFDISSGGYLFVSSRSIKATAAGDSKGTLDERKAIDIAKSWLKDKGLMPPGKVEAKVAPSTGAAVAAKSIAGRTLTVSFAAKLDGRDIYLENRGSDPAPFASVEVDRGGEVIAARGQLLSDLVSSEYALRPVGQVFKELGASWPAALLLPQSEGRESAASSALAGTAAERTAPRTQPGKPAQTMTVRSVEIAYVLVADSDRGSFFEPVYVFTGSLDGSNGRIEGAKIIAPALKEESLERVEGRSGAMRSLPGGLGLSGAPSNKSGASPARPAPPAPKR